MKNSQKGFATALLLTIIVILVIGAGIAYLTWQKNKTTPNDAWSPTANWETYTNTKYGFSFKYPKEYSVGIHAEVPRLVASTPDAYAINVFTKPLETADYNTGSIIEFRGETGITAPLTINSIIKASCGDNTLCYSKDEINKYKEVEVAGTKGYMSTSIGGEVTYYFVQNKPAGQIIEISIYNPIARNIFETFKFTNYIPSQSVGDNNGGIPAITQQELKDGWYYGSIDQKKPGTPTNWTNIDSNSRNARWVAPNFKLEQ